MDLQELFSRPETPYVIGGMVGLAGYVLGRISSKVRLKAYDLKIAQVGLACKEEENRVRITELMHKENEREDLRDKEREEADRRTLLDLCERLKPVFDDYLEQVLGHGAKDNDILELRQRYREQFVGKYIEALEEDSKITEEDYEINKEKIESFVDAMHPYDEEDDERIMPELPEELSSFISRVNKRFESLE